MSIRYNSCHGILRKQRSCADPFDNSWCHLGYNAQVRHTQWHTGYFEVEPKSMRCTIDRSKRVVLHVCPWAFGCCDPLPNPTSDRPGRFGAF